MYVLKFGGTSMGSVEAIRRVAALVEGYGKRGPAAVVVSAMSGVTDELLRLARQAASQDEDWAQSLDALEEKHSAVFDTLVADKKSWAPIAADFSALRALYQGICLLGECSPRSADRVAAFGELLSSRIFAAHLANRISTEWADSRKLIRTDSQFGAAHVQFAVTEQLVRGYFGNRAARVFVLPGFIASNETGETTTLGRGGSDYTAAIIGAALPEAEVEIWTDVAGMMTADPRLVPAARTISALSFQEAMELSHFGAKVLYPPAVQPLMKKDRAVRIRNTFAPDEPGTLIHAQPLADRTIIRGISSITGIALVSLEGSGMVGIPGFSHRLFGALARHQINVILITQASSEHTICVAIQSGSVDAAIRAVQEEFRNEIREGSIEPLQCETGLAIVALVGDQMKNHSGISGRKFSELGRNGINIRAIAQGSSERNISTVISGSDVRKAINVLHEAFFETEYKQVNLFIAGAGNVGRKLLSQIAQQQAWLQQHLRIQLRVIAIANSRTMAFAEGGIALAHWESELQQGDAMDGAAFQERVAALNLRNSVFVDVTAQESVAATYEAFLKRSIPVVACNKIAASATYARYSTLKDLSKEFGAPFFFETNVGAGLPVISTLSDLMSSGDQVHQIEAVLSGTLNFVFNNYDGSRPFADVVRDAQAQGYTEPDPRLDLGGTDVARKILILAREAGAELEFDAIQNTPFLPPSCMEGSIEDFYVEMERHEEHFRALLEEAKTAGKRLKYVARFSAGAASVGLQAIDAQHDFYHLYGKDNVVRFFTNRYVEQPLVVKGAGAGAEVTASGIFADIIKTARS
ncbi:MAG: bifunctional aspartate kinase/homoserine dehydrogenase I [Chitinophagaceae bacterium]|nr:MAG: bifunctional aspartate kinase/homoserine dehydrogenase I [Chitinophagaceae bacterium]